MTSGDTPAAAFGTDAFPCGCLVSSGIGEPGMRCIVHANRYAHEIAGLAPGSLVERSLSDLFTRASCVMIESYVIPLVLSEGRCEEILLEIAVAGGDKVPVLVNATTGDGEDSRIFWSLFRATQRDRLDQELVEARRRLEEQSASLRELSITDDLTGLNNRRELFRRLESALKQAKRAQWPVAVLMVDLDNFKMLNDAHGHRAGDRVLEELGRLFLDQGRASDIVARYGGEEFVFVLPGLDQASARRTADRIHDLARRIDVGAPVAGVTLSIGIAVAQDPGAASGEGLIEQADRALYRAKAAGRDTTVVLGE